MSFPEALPGRRQRQVDSTRARLFQAALAEFRRAGFARASVSRIAREAGVSRPSFYFHFPTKEHVLLELEWLEERGLAERMQPTSSLREALRALAEGILEMEGRLESELVRDMFTIFARWPAELRIEEQPYPVVRELARHFGEAAARGELRAGLEPSAAAQLCLTSVMGLLIGPPRGPERRREDFALLFSLYLDERGAKEAEEE